MGNACCSGQVSEEEIRTDLLGPLHDLPPVEAAATAQAGPAAASSAAPAAQGATISYNDKGSLRNILCSKDVQLIKPEYFIYLHTHGLRMPKCQDVPREWVLDVDVELDWGSLEIISVSYCWIAKHHPDPEGYHLQTLFHLCSRFVAGSPLTAKDKYYWSVDGRGLNAPVRYLMNQGYCFGSGDGRPAGVFIDWMSIPQDQPKGARTTEETVVFKRALKNVNIWYGHKETMTWRLTSLPFDVQRAGYDASGWPTFERCIAGIISSQHRMLLIDERRRTELETAGGDYMQLSLDFCDRFREAPITPEAFNELVQDKIFTEGSDKDQIVIPRYRDTFMTTIGDATELQMQSLGFRDPQAREVMKLVRAYGRVKSLNLSESSISVPLEDWAALALDVQLTCLTLGMNQQLPGNMKVVQPLVNLTVLKLYNTKVTGDIEALNILVNLTELWLHDTQVKGDIQAVQTMVKLTNLDLNTTQVNGDIQAVEPLINLSVLYLHNTQVTGDIGTLHTLVNLTLLDLDNTKVTGNIEALDTLVKLTDLRLFDTQVTGDIQGVHHLVRLTDLHLHNTKVAGDIEALRPLVKLTDLRLFETQVMGDISAVQLLVNLTWLDLANTQVTGDILAVQTLVKLTRLVLNDTKVSGNILAVQALVHLTLLGLRDTQVSGDIQAVQPLVKLTKLRLTGTQVSGDKAAVRDAWVDRRGSPDGLYL